MFFSSTFSALYDYKYLRLLSMVSPLSRSALCSRFLTVSGAFTA